MIRFSGYMVWGFAVWMSTAILGTLFSANLEVLNYMLGWPVELLGRVLAPHDPHLLWAASAPYLEWALQVALLGAFLLLMGWLYYADHQQS